MDIKAQLLSLQQKGQKDEDKEYIKSQVSRVSTIKPFLYSLINFYH